MNTIAQSDSYAQFMRLVATARERTGAVAAKTAPVRSNTVSFPAIAAQARPETRMLPVVNKPAETQAKGRILGTYFDAYA